jgi:hypothetical protein
MEKLMRGVRRTNRLYRPCPTYVCKWIAGKALVAFHLLEHGVVIAC